MNQVLNWMDAPLDEGITLIEAGAGTGKTFTITGLVLRLLLEKEDLEIDRVLVVTFTKAATQELHTRIRAKLHAAVRVFKNLATDPDLEQLRIHHGNRGLAKLEKSLLNFDQIKVTTIHGFCKRVLEQSAFESGIPFDVTFLSDDARLRIQAARDFWRRSVMCGHPLLANLAVVKKWSPDEFLKDYAEWRRYPNTEVIPDAPDLDVLETRMESILVALKADWDREEVAHLLQHAKEKKGKFDKSRLDDFLDKLDLLAQGNFIGLDQALMLGGVALEKTFFKKELDTLNANPFIQTCDTLASFIDEVQQILRIAYINGVHENFERARLDDNLITYDDLLYRLHQAVAHPELGPRIRAAVRNAYHVALIDEFQDTDLVQYEIFRRCFIQRPVFLIGDPKQAIYAFRGADIFAYMAAKHDAHQSFTLDKNWRSHRLLVKAVNQIFLHGRRPFVFPEISFPEARPSGTADAEALRGDDLNQLVWLYMALDEEGKPFRKDVAEQRICNAIAEEIVALLKNRVTSGERPLHPGDIAVLVRSNAQAEQVKETLGRAGLPAVIAQSGNVFQSMEAEQLQMLLEAVLDPRRSGRLHAAMASELWGAKASDLFDLERDEEAAPEILEQLGDWRRRWFAHGFMPMIREAFAQLEVRKRLRTYHNGERRLTNLLHLAELLHQQAVDQNLSPDALLRLLANERVLAHQNLQRGFSEMFTAELRLESDARAVQITTIHKSKGLEYTVAFCPFLWNSIPVRDGDNVLAHVDHDRVVYDCGSDDYAAHREQAERERLAEDLRLAYVALTRAKQRCYVVWGPAGTTRKSGGAFGAALGSAMAYLLHQPVEVDDGGNGWVGRVQQHVAQTWEVWRSELEALVNKNPDCMSLRFLPEVSPPGVPRAPRADDAHQHPLQARTWEGNALRERIWGIASFSSIAQGREHAYAGDYADPSAPAAEDQSMRPSGIFAFARGAHAGICLHDILEHMDFQQAQDPDTEKLVHDTLSRFELLDPPRHPFPVQPVSAVSAMVRRLVANPLPGLDFCFADLSNAQRLNEWQFHLPLQQTEVGRLADVFAEFTDSEAVRKGYVPLLRKLDARQLTGFLTGFVDMVFSYKDRWYLVDWKSNYLGAQAQDYEPARLHQAMFEHHYILQYHLYITALHRFLKARLRHYSYRKHMGPALYVFLRGVDGQGDGGFYSDQPSQGLIEALDRLFHGEAP